MGITFKSFSNCVSFVTAVKKPVLLRSRHGVGKSSVVYDYAKHVGLPVVERRASQMTEGDLLGLPKPEDKEGYTKWLPPDWLKEACDNPVVLFFDEIDRATTEVRQGFFELTDSRKLSGQHLHEGTLIFAAVNGGEHGAQYQVGEMDPAELDRWTVFDIEPSLEDWLEWAKKDNNIHRIIVDFIRQCPQHLEHNDDFEPNKVYPSRRSWHRLSDCLTQGNLIEPGQTSPILFNLASSFIGQEGAFALQDFIKQYQKQLTTEDILDKGLWEETKGFDINEQTALVEKIEASGRLDKDLSDEQIDNLANWLLVLPSEAAMKLWSIIGDNVTNVIKIHSHSTQVKEYILAILGTEMEKKEKK